MVGTRRSSLGFSRTLAAFAMLAAAILLFADLPAAHAQGTSRLTGTTGPSSSKESRTVPAGPPIRARTSFPVSARGVEPPPKGSPGAGAGGR